MAIVGPDSSDAVQITAQLSKINGVAQVCRYLLFPVRVNYIIINKI